MNDGSGNRVEQDHIAPPRASTRGAFILPRHKSVARSIGYCLCLNEHADWWELSDLLRSRLTSRERMALAAMAIASLDPECGELVAASLPILSQHWGVLS